MNRSKAKFIKLYIQNASAEAHSPNSALLNPKSVQATIKKEMCLFEAGGTRGLVLEGAYKALLAIPPTSVESERAFSAAVYLWSKIRCSVAEWQTKPSILYVSCAHIFKIMLE